MAANKAGPAKTVVSAVGAVGNVSLHSSNDSGFSNEPPPQPDVDYSDEEAQRLRVPIRYATMVTVQILVVSYRKNSFFYVFSLLDPFCSLIL